MTTDELIREKMVQAVVTNTKQQIKNYREGVVKQPTGDTMTIGKMIYTSPKLLDEVDTTIDTIFDYLINNKQNTSQGDLTNLRGIFKNDLKTVIENLITGLNHTELIDETKFIDIEKYNLLEEEKREIASMALSLYEEKEKLEELNGNINNAEKLKEELKTILIELQTEIKLRKEQIEELEAREKDVQIKINVSERESVSLLEYINSLKQRVNELESQEATLKITVLELEGLTKELQKTNSDLEYDIMVMAKGKELSEGLKALENKIIDTVSEIKPSNDNVQIDLTPINEKLDKLEDSINVNIIKDQALRQSNAKGNSLLSRNKQMQRELDTMQIELNSKSSTIAYYQELNGDKEHIRVSRDFVRNQFTLLAQQVGVSPIIANDIFERSPSSNQALLIRIAEEISYDESKYNLIVEWFAEHSKTDTGILYIPTATTAILFTDNEYKNLVEEAYAITSVVLKGKVHKYVLDTDLLKDMDLNQYSEREQAILSRANKNALSELLTNNMGNQLAPIIDNLRELSTDGEELAYMMYNLIRLSNTPLEQIRLTAQFITPELTDTVIENLPILQSIKGQLGNPSVDTLTMELEKIIPFLNNEWVVRKFASFAVDYLKSGAYMIDIVGVREDGKLVYHTVKPYTLEGNPEKNIFDAINEFLKNSTINKSHAEGSTTGFEEVAYVTPILFSLRKGIATNE